jgi:hypothetical protein
MTAPEPPNNAQVTAFLFDHNGFVHVAVEDVDEASAFVLENSDSGASQLASLLAPLVDRSRPPFFCISASEGASLSGAFFGELLAAPVPRFIVAQPRYLLFAKKNALADAHPCTLLRAYRDMFPAHRGA